MSEDRPGHDRLLDLLLSMVVQETGAERGFLLRATPDGALRFASTRNLDDEAVHGPAMKVSTSLVAEAVRTGRMLCIDDAAADPRYAHARSVARMALRSVLVAPIAHGGQVRGVLYLDNRFVAGRFGQRERGRVETHAERLGAALVDDGVAPPVTGLAQVYRESSLELVDRYGLARIVGRSAPMRALLDDLRKLAASDRPVLITGETGTGKELVAKAIHYNGPRRAGPFVAENCGALAEGLLETELFGCERGAFTGADRARTGLVELAHGGTLLLDEVAEMSPALQRKLLRVLQEGALRPVGATEVRRVDVRILAATHQELAADVAAGRFLADLYWRLAVLRLTVPPLRERTEDIPLLVEALLEGSGKTVDADAMVRLVGHPWPGNVRELANVLDRARILVAGEVITAGDIALDEVVPGTVPPVGRRDRPGLAGGLNERQARLLAALRSGQLTSNGEYAAHARVSRSTALRDLDELVKLGLLERLGTGRWCRYRRLAGRS